MPKTTKNASAPKKMTKTQKKARLKHIMQWKERQKKEKKKAETRLNRYIDGLVKKYPAGYIDKIKEGLESDTKFNETVQELDFELEASAEKSTDDEFLEKLSRDLKLDDE